MIKKASKSDINQIMELVSDIINEMKKVQNNQWDETYPTENVFENDVENGNLYVYKNNSDKVMGFVCIDTNEPMEYSELEWEYEGEAFVIHRMGVETNSRKSGVGKALMEHAEKLAKLNNIKSIRSDTYFTNKAMNLVFEKLGYNFVGSINILEKPFKFNCYEKYIS